MTPMDRQGKSYAKEMVRRSTGREIPDLLRELYVEKRHSQEEIARALDINRMTVGAWLSEYGISRLDRHAVSLEGSTP